MTTREVESPFQIGYVEHGSFQGTPAQWRNLKSFFTDVPAQIEVFDSSPIAIRYEKIAQKLREDFEVDLTLPDRLKDLYLGVLTLDHWRKTKDIPEAGLQIPDANLIQDWVVEVIGPDEFPQIAKYAFEDWAERLTDKPIPHISQANEWIGERIARHFESHDSSTTARTADLGLGTGATKVAADCALRSLGFTDIDSMGVDITPILLNRAEELLRQNGINASLEVGNAINWLKKQADSSLDVATMVYAIHHLHYDQQKELESLIFKKIKPGGVYAVADPTGKSEFNLRNLDINEPEATAACFRPEIKDVINELELIGFTVSLEGEERETTGRLGTVSAELGDTLDQGTLGYAVVAVKP